MIFCYKGQLNDSQIVKENEELAPNGPDADSGWISTRQSMTFIRWLTCKSKPIDAKDIDG